MITDYFLKFASKEEALQVFSTIPEHTHTSYDPETNTPLDTLEVTSQTETFTIDEVGVLFKNDGVYSEDTLELITPPTQIPGYHYSYRTVYGNKPEIYLPNELEDYAATPQNPKRIFL